jgi:hypothetical protein
MRELFLGIIAFFGNLVRGEIRKARERKKKKAAKKKALKEAKRKAAEEAKRLKEKKKKEVVVTVTYEKTVSDEELSEISKPRPLDPNPYDEEE